MEPDDVERAVAICLEALAAGGERDWEVPAGELTWSCRRTLDHISDALLHYATHLATRSATHRYGVRNMDAEATIPQLREAAGAAAAILRRICAEAGPEVRAFHPAGLADVTGFIAMGCDEALIHTDDIAQGLGLPFEPPEDLCRAVLTRLFPWAPDGYEPWLTLRWANGRQALGPHERLASDWYWHCAPLLEWDGTRKVRTTPPAWT